MKQKKSGSARRIVCLVLAAVMLLGLVSNAASSSEIKKELSGLRNQQAELKKEREALQAKIKENQSKTQTLVDKKSDIDQQISMTQASISNLNEQVQQYSLLIANKQAELEAAEYTGSASGEMVTVKMNGKHEVLSITIKPEAVDPDDIEMLEDMVAAAINATVKQVDETAEAEMGKLTGGLNIPGL